MLRGWNPSAEYIVGHLSIGVVCISLIARVFDCAWACAFLSVHKAIILSMFACASLCLPVCLSAGTFPSKMCHILVGIQHRLEKWLSKKLQAQRCCLKEDCVHEQWVP